MANILPPLAPPGTPTLITLPAGTTYFRVHQSAYPAASFNPTPSHRYYGGGRFDSTDDDSYGYLYMGDTVDVAVSETLLRDLNLSPTGHRVVPRRKVRGRRISAVTLTVDIDIVSLRTGHELGALGQDPWLTTADPRDYAQTRHWGHWIRSHVPHAAGYRWLSRREPADHAYVLFDDRLPPDTVLATSDPAVPAGPLADFDTGQGLRALRRRLNAYQVVITGH